MNPVQEKMIAEMGIGPIWTLRQNLPEKQIVSPVSSNPTDFGARTLIEGTLGTDSNNPACLICGWCSMASKTIATGQSSEVSYFFIHENSYNRETATTPTLPIAADALLNSVLRELRVQRGVSAYVANIEQPKPGARVDRRLEGQECEMLACLSCVKKQIGLIRPSVIISLGSNAAISLLGLEGDTTINDLRGALSRYEDTPLIVTYELEYLLLHPKEKSGLWSDLCLALNALQIQ